MLTAMALRRTSLGFVPSVGSASARLGLSSTGSGISFIRGRSDPLAFQGISSIGAPYGRSIVNLLGGNLGPISPVKVSYCIKKHAFSTMVKLASNTGTSCGLGSYSIWKQSRRYLVRMPFHAETRVKKHAFSTMVKLASNTGISCGLGSYSVWKQSRRYLVRMPFRAETRVKVAYMKSLKRHFARAPRVMGRKHVRPTKNTIPKEKPIPRSPLEQFFIDLLSAIRLSIIDKVSTEILLIISAVFCVGVSYMINHFQRESEVLDPTNSELPEKKIAEDQLMLMLEEAKELKMKQLSDFSVLFSIMVPIIIKNTPKPLDPSAFFFVKPADLYIS